MNTGLDSGTVFRVSALLFLMMSVVTWIVLGRPRRGSALVWCAGGMLVGLSVCLIGLRGLVGEFWSYTVAQSAYLASFLVLVQSLRMDMQRAWRWRWLLAVVLAYAALIAFGFDDKRAQGLAVLVRLVNSAGLLVLTVTALMLARQERSSNAWFMTLGYGLMSAAMLLATAATIWGHANLDVSAGVFTHILGWFSLLTLLMSYTGYLGLALERSLRQNMALRQAQWQDQQWRERKQALTLRDRQHTLSALANSLGHDIVQPLTATLLNVQMARWMLQSGPVDKLAMQQLLAQVVQGLQRSADMVDRIRGFLRSSPARVGLMKLQSVVQDAENLLRQEMMYRGVAFEVTLPRSDVLVEAEALPLMQALVQVVRNAMQAVQGLPRPSISVSLNVSETQAWIEVQDSGPGFPAAMLNWTPDDVPSAQDMRGGLGLYITQGIMGQFGGKVALTNASTGGAVVRLILPSTGPVPV